MLQSRQFFPLKVIALCHNLVYVVNKSVEDGLINRCRDRLVNGSPDGKIVLNTIETLALTR